METPPYRPLTKHEKDEGRCIRVGLGEAAVGLGVSPEKLSRAIQITQGSRVYNDPPPSVTLELVDRIAAHLIITGARVE